MDRREARRVFKSYGARVAAAQDRTGVTYEFPDGARFSLGEHESERSLSTKVSNVRHRYGLIPSKQLVGLSKVGNAPRLDLERLHASEHAKDRLALMQSQAKVTYADVLHTLTLPERVLWSERHDSWVWLRHPLAVAVCEVRDGLLIKTILWSSNELFALHPRPKESA